MLWSDIVGSRTTHSTPVTPAKISGDAGARAVAWIFNAVLLTIMASGFAISAAGYCVAAWSAAPDLFIGRTELARTPFEGATLNQKDGHAEPR